jgi:histone chaperone ASF1
VGNAEDSLHDQVLEEVMVGPVPVGINRFVLTSNAPNPAEIANQDLLGVTVILITCSYMDNKFIQIGYYVNNEYSEPYDTENPPNPVDITKLYRNILSDQPRVTRFNIDWTGGTGPAVASEEVDQQQEVQEGEGEDLAEMEEDDEDDEEDDEDEDENAEVDLADQEEEDENDEIDTEGDGEEADEEGTDDATSQQRHYNGMEMILNEDSNSMDVARMLA